MKQLVAGDTYYGILITSDATGAAAAPDGTPTAAAYMDGAVCDPTFTLTVDATPLETGVYSVSGTVPAVTSGKFVQMVGAATIDGIACKWVVDEIQIDLLQVNVTQIGGKSIQVPQDVVRF